MSRIRRAGAISLSRVIEAQKYTVSTGSEDTCQQVLYSYDSNPYDSGSYTTNALGRLAAVNYWGGDSRSGCNTACSVDIQSTPGTQLRHLLRSQLAMPPNLEPADFNRPDLRPHQLQ